MTDVLWAANSIQAGQELGSADGRTRLCMQGDGNLVVYERYGPGWVTTWKSGTSGHSGSRLSMQGDGNLVIYTPANKPVWASNTVGAPQPRLAVQADGNVVLYGSNNKAYWSSDTWRRGRRLPNFSPATQGFWFSNQFTNVVIDKFGVKFETQGRCGGMAYAALDYFRSGLPIPRQRQVPTDGHWLADYIYGRLFDSFATVSAAKNVDWVFRPDHDTFFGGKGVTRLTKEDEFIKLRQRIDGGNLVPLGLVNATNVTQMGNDNHQVLAYGYEWIPAAGYIGVYVYDNNYPRSEALIVSHAGTKTFTTYIGLTLKKTWRGFFVIDYTYKVPPYRTLMPPPRDAPVRFGQTVKLSHVATGHTLHSHAANYGHAGGSGQQQVTCFQGWDDNDLWRIKTAHAAADQRHGQQVGHGDVIRLEHVLTKRNLHSHSGHVSPVTKQQEVTCFGNNGTGDTNDNWVVEVDGGGKWQEGSRLRLIHQNTNHALHSHLGHRHKDWTANQQEITAYPGRDSNDFWWLFEVR